MGPFKGPSKGPSKGPQGLQNKVFKEFPIHTPPGPQDPQQKTYSLDKKIGLRRAGGGQIFVQDVFFFPGALGVFIKNVYNHVLKLCVPGWF